jgi:hypothetical protein
MEIYVCVGDRFFCKINTSKKQKVKKSFKHFISHYAATMGCHITMNIM